jgi:hypothetical protein
LISRDGGIWYAGVAIFTCITYACVFTVFLHLFSYTIGAWNDPILIAFLANSGTTLKCLMRCCGKDQPQPHVSRLIPVRTAKLASMPRFCCPTHWNSENLEIRTSYNKSKRSAQIPLGIHNQFLTRNDASQEDQEGC